MNFSVTQASENQNITEAEVKQEGASLFIIIAIIALVIILCVAFYGYRSCKSRNQPLQPVEINVEEGKALMDDKNDDKNGDKNDDKNDDKNKVEENQEQPKPSESATPAENGNYCLSKVFTHVKISKNDKGNYTMPSNFIFYNWDQNPIEFSLNRNVSSRKHHFFIA